MKIHQLDQQEILDAAENGRVKEFGLTAEQLGKARSPDGWTGLHWVAKNGDFKQVVGGVTLEQLGKAVDNEGNSALNEAIEQGHLRKLNATAAQLANIKGPNGCTALHWAAACEALKDIKGGATAQDLAAAKDNDHWTALHAAAADHCLSQVRGGLQAPFLASVVTLEAGESVLHHATDQLDQIEGLTLDLLLHTRNKENRSVFQDAIEHGNLPRVTGKDIGKFWRSQTPELQEEILEEFASVPLSTRDISGIFGNSPEHFWMELTAQQQASWRKALDGKPVPDRIQKAMELEQNAHLTRASMSTSGMDM